MYVCTAEQTLTGSCQPHHFLPPKVKFKIRPLPLAEVSSFQTPDSRTPNSRTPASSLEDHKGRKSILCKWQQEQASRWTVTGKTLLMRGRSSDLVGNMFTCSPPNDECLSTINSALPVGVTMRPFVAERRASSMTTTTHPTLPCARLDLVRAKARTAIFTW